MCVLELVWLLRKERVIESIFKLLAVDTKVKKWRVILTGG